MSKIDPIKSLHDFVNDMKPYHTKVFDIFVDYKHDDPIVLSISDKMKVTTAISYSTDSEVCTTAGFDVEPFDGGWESILEMSDTSIIEVNAPGLYFSIGGNYLGHFASKMIEARPNSYQIHVTSPNHTFTVTNISFDAITFRTKIFVSESLFAMTGGKVSVPANSNWDYPDRCIDPATGVRSATPLRVVATILEDFVIKNDGIALAEIVGVGRFQHDIAVGYGGNAGLLRKTLTAVDPVGHTIDITGDWTLFFFHNSLLTVFDPLLVFFTDPTVTIYNSSTNTTRLSIIMGGAAQANMNALALDFLGAHIIVQTFNPHDDPTFGVSSDVWDGDSGWDWGGLTHSTETLFKETLQISTTNGDATPITGAWDGNQWDMAFFNAGLNAALAKSQQY